MAQAKLAIFRTLDRYMTVEEYAGAFDPRNGYLTVFKADADVALVIAATRYRNPGVTVFYWDDENEVIRIH